jgi:hypothetical protein
MFKDPNAQERALHQLNTVYQGRAPFLTFSSWFLEVSQLAGLNDEHQMIRLMYKHMNQELSVAIAMGGSIDRFTRIDDLIFLANEI